LEEHLQPVERVCEAFQPFRNRKFLLFFHPAIFEGAKVQFLYLCGI
jgi:hypothetical protein